MSISVDGDKMRKVLRDLSQAVVNALEEKAVDSGRLTRADLIEWLGLLFIVESLLKVYERLDKLETYGKVTREKVDGLRADICACQGNWSHK